MAGIPAASWADAVEEADHEHEREAKNDEWHEGLRVQRGQSRARLDLSHGFVRDIVSPGLGARPHPPSPLQLPHNPSRPPPHPTPQVKNQHDRDQYERACRDAQAVVAQGRKAR